MNRGLLPKKAPDAEKFKGAWVTCEACGFSAILDEYDTGVIVSEPGTDGKSSLTLTCPACKAKVVHKFIAPAEHASRAASRIATTKAAKKAGK